VASVRQATAQLQRATTRAKEAEKRYSEAHHNVQSRMKVAATKLETEQNQTILHHAESLQQLVRKPPSRMLEEYHRFVATGNGSEAISIATHMVKKQFQKYEHDLQVTKRQHAHTLESAKDQIRGILQTAD